MRNAIWATVGILFLFAVQSARADVFTVSDVPIDATASSVSQARAIAMQEGTRQAADFLINRLSLAQDRQEAGFTGLDDEQAGLLVAGIRIKNEQRSDRRYLAELTVLFDPQRVRNLLTSLKIPFVEAQTANVLVLPVYDAPDSGPILWNSNYWWDSWADATPQDDLVPFITPLADLGDRQAISAAQAMRLDDQALQAIAARYSVHKVMVAAASPAGPGRVSVRSRTISWDQDSAPEVLSQQVTGDGAAETNSIDALKEAYAQARAQLVAQAENQWKHQAIVRSDNTTTVVLTAQYQNLAQWRRLRKLLAGSPLIHEARLEALTNTGAMMTIAYVGTRDQLARQLGQGGVEMLDTDIGPVARLR